MSSRFSVRSSDTFGLPLLCLASSPRALALSGSSRRIGQMIPQMQERGELDAGKGGDRNSLSYERRVKLSDIGISHNQSSAFQAIARLPEETFEEHIVETRAVERKKPPRCGCTFGAAGTGLLLPLCFWNCISNLKHLQAPAAQSWGFLR